MRALAHVSFSAVFLFSLQALAQQPSSDQPPGDIHILYFGLALVAAAIVLWVVAARYRRRIS